MSFEDSEAVKIELKAHTKNYSMLRIAYVAQLFYNGKISFLELFSNIRDMVSQASKFYNSGNLASWNNLHHSFRPHTVNVVASIIAHKIRLHTDISNI